MNESLERTYSNPVSAMLKQLEYKNEKRLDAYIETVEDGAETYFTVKVRGELNEE